MPRPDGLRLATVAYLRALSGKGYSSKTLEGYEYAMRRAHRVLSESGRPPPPRLLRERHIRILRSRLGHSAHLLRDISTVLNGMGCKVPLEYEIPPRTNVEWLSEAQARTLRETAMHMGPPYSTLVHLELENGFRRVSVMRARADDLRRNSLLIHGKGRDYSIAPHPKVFGVWTETLEWREREGFAGSDFLVPSPSTGTAYSETGMDGLLSRVCRRAGIEASHHTLRRTFGRFVWKSGVELEIVADLLGHKDVRQTIRYLGIDLMDQGAAMAKYAASF